MCLLKGFLVGVAGSRVSSLLLPLDLAVVTGTEDDAKDLPYPKARGWHECLARQFLG